MTLPPQYSLRTESPWRIVCGVVLALLIALTPGPSWMALQAQEEKKEERPGANAKADADADTDDKGKGADSPDATEGEAVVPNMGNAMQGGMSPEMSELFPIGRPFEGVRIPNYVGDTLSSVVNAEVMRRVDEEHLDMEKLTIVSFGAGESPDTKIYMDRATYDMSSGKLISRTPTRIVQSRFEMTGDKMTFDSVTQIGHMTSNPGGRVRMLIFEVDQVLSDGMFKEPDPD